MGISPQLVVRTSMGVGSALSELGRFLDECEDCDAITRVEFAGTANDGRVVAATLEVAVDPCTPTESGFTPDEAAVADDGTLTVSFESPTSLLPVGGFDVDVTPVQTTCTDGATVVELRATVPTEPAATGGGTTTSRATETDVDDGTHVSVKVGQNESESGSTTDESGSTTAETGPTTAETDSNTGSSASFASSRSRDVPPFRDTELLREVYETCDTFSEMPEALGMDVTAETVRRYMIRQGIHEPTSYDTSSDENDGDTETETDGAAESDAVDDHGTGHGDESDDGHGLDDTDHVDDTEHGDDDHASPPAEDLESPAVLADGIGLPDDVTIDTIVEAVQTSNTIYEVKQGIGIEREDALEMLRELNLLEFVAGRLATEAEREVSRDQIIDRLREQADAM